MSLEVILAQGDAVEQRIFLDAEFASTFHVYLRVWDSYIRPNRAPGQLGVTEDWRQLAQHHYPAIMRCWGMYEARNSIKDLSERWDCSTDMILAAQAGLFGYYSCAGSIVDNLDKCFYDLDNSQPVKAIGSMGTFFERRNIEMHDGIRPIFDFDGAPAFDKSLYGEQPDDWEGGKQSLVLLDEWIEDEWAKFVCDVQAAWCQLLSKLQKVRGPGAPSIGPISSGRSPDQQPGVSGQISS